MPWTSITKPTQGKPTRKSLIDSIIDDLAFLFGRNSSAVTIVNQSFEDDVDADGIPDGWTRTLFSGGVFLLDNTDQQSGLYSVKFTSPGGAGNGGGYIENTDAFPVSPNRAVEALWEMKSSVAGVSNRVEFFWFKSDLTASATPSTSLYNSTSNPTSWTALNGVATPPSDARFAKVRLTGCHTASTTAGNTRFDNIQINFPPAQRIFIFNASGAWVCPKWCSRVQVEVWGGGGGGHATDSSTERGGGSGSYATGNYNVTPGTSYTVTVGAGGAGGNPGNGADGGDSSFDTFLTAFHGTGGSTGSGGVGGALGTGADFSIVGQNQAPVTPYTGGSAPRGGSGGTHGGGAAANGVAPGGGGGCAAFLNVGGNGAAGRVIVFAFL